MTAPDPPEGRLVDRLAVAARRYDDPDVVRMVAAVQDEYVRMYGGPDAASLDTREFEAPAGVLFVGTLDGAAVAMGGWRRLPVLGPDVAELKRMYVDPAVRGRGLSHPVLAAVERSAAAAGIDRLVLNTGPVQRVAIALYTAAGYRPVPPFGHYAQLGEAVFLGKVLDGGATPGRNGDGPSA